MFVQHARVAADPGTVADELFGDLLPVEQALDSPFLLLGSVDAICDRVQELQERCGFSYLTVIDGRAEGFDQVVARLG